MKQMAAQLSSVQKRTERRKLLCQKIRSRVRWRDRIRR